MTDPGHPPTILATTGAVGVTAGLHPAVTPRGQTDGGGPRVLARTTLASRWRERAEALERSTRRCRAQRDVREAMDAEQAAADYRIAAADLEAGVALEDIR